MSPPRAAPSHRLLVVDDNRAIHQDFRKILSPDGGETALDALEAELFAEEVCAEPRHAFAIESAFQGREALELVDRARAAGQPHALAFVDMRMPPGWDGLETVERLWRVAPDLQVVICTAYSDHSWSEITSRVAVGDRLLVLKKPFDSIEVIQLAHALTRKWELQREREVRLRDLDCMVAERTRSLEEANRRLADEMASRQRAETELRLAQKLEAVGQLAAGIAHEINTPVQYVGDNARFLKDAFDDLLAVDRAHAGLLEAARAGPVPAALLDAVSRTRDEADLAYLEREIPKAIDQTLGGVERIARIVRAMKDFSHPGGASRELVDVNRSLETTIAVARNEWKYVADMHTDLAPELPSISAYPGELGQVFLNLVVNAAHAVAGVVGDGSAGKGIIAVRTRYCGDAVEVRIADSGPGIPAEIRQRIFDPFFTTKEVGKGTGQGLAIARSVVVDKHGGTLELEVCSEEVGAGNGRAEAGVTVTGKRRAGGTAEGAIFVIRLPIAPPGNGREGAAG